MPIDLLSFDADIFNGFVILKWTTASEGNARIFWVQRSTDGQNWETIGKVESKAVDGYSSIPLDYAYTDDEPINGTNFYRLKQVLMGGTVLYSEVKRIQFQRVGNITISPNPAKTEVLISGLVEGQHHVVITNTLGQVVYETTINTSGNYLLDISSLPSNLYFVHIKLQNGEGELFKLIKN